MYDYVSSTVLANLRLNTLSEPTSANSFQSTSQTVPLAHSSSARSKRRAKRRHDNECRIRMRTATRNIVQNSNPLRVHREFFYLPILPDDTVISSPPKGKLLGGSSSGVMTTNHHSPKESTMSLLPLDPEENWWPLYVNLASKLQTHSTQTPFSRDVLEHDRFQDLPTDHWTYELGAMGIDFASTASPIEQLLPNASSLLTMYRADSPPKIDVPHLSLEEALSHLRIVHQRLQQISRRLKKTQKQLNSWFRNKAPNTAHIKAENIERLLLLQQNLRTSHRQFNELHQTLQKKSKARVKEVTSTLSRQVFVPYDLPPIPTYNRFSILDDHSDRTPMKTWYDFLPQIPHIDEAAVVPHAKTTTNKASNRDSTPMEVLISARQELASSAPTILHQAINMAYNVQGCYKSKDAESAAALTVTTWNINCLTGHKAHLVGRIMKQDKSDVLIMVDTRHSPCTTRSFKKIFVSCLGAGSQVYFSHDPNRRPGEPGGIVIVIGPKWGTSYMPQSSRTDYSGHGILASIRLRTSTSFIHIMGTYWPFVPPKAMSSDDVSKKLFNRLLAYCRKSHPQNPDPIQYVQHLLLQWMANAWQDGCCGQIAGGDFNSRWLPSDRGGQRALFDWANANYLINGPRHITDRGGMSFITYGRNDWSDGTWIDHLLHAGDPETFDIVGAFNDLGSLLDGVSDHKPLLAVYKTPPPFSSTVKTMPKPRPRPELPRSDKRQIASFKSELTKMLSQVSPTVNSISQAEEALEVSTQCVVHLVRRLNDSMRPKIVKHKDGYSPEYVLRKFHLAAVLEIRRHITGQNQTKDRWVGYHSIQNNVRQVFHKLDKLANQLRISNTDRHRILNIPNASLDFWLSCPAGPTEILCTNAIKCLRSKLHGRQRTDMRLAHKGYMSFIESQREQGKLRSVIRAILGANAGRKHTDSIPLEVVASSDGKIITTPAELHKECTNHYISHHKLPVEHNNELHTAEDWLPYIEDKEKFLHVFKDSNIPIWCLDIIHQALQEKPQAAAVRAQLSETLLIPPTLEEFKKSIKKSKTNSAPGMSGLSYNMLKSYPRDMVEYVYNLWIWFWNKPDIDLP